MRAICNSKSCCTSFSFCTEIFAPSTHPIVIFGLYWFRIVNKCNSFLKKYRFAHLPQTDATIIRLHCCGSTNNWCSFLATRLKCSQRFSCKRLLVFICLVLTGINIWKHSTCRMLHFFFIHFVLHCCTDIRGGKIIKMYTIKKGLSISHLWNI